MTSVLITAFQPYDRWTANSSWLALVELTRNLPAEPTLTTRLYPVDFAAVREKLQDDLQADYDFAVHLGQAPGAASVRLEAVGLNIGGTSRQLSDEHQPLVEDGPVAYRSSLPLADWAAKLRQNGIPTQVSYHAGTYLCNATLYLCHHLAQQQGRRTRSVFVHLPLSPAQALEQRDEIPSMASETAATALRLLLEELAKDDAQRA